MGCGMACVACTTECATGTQKCVTWGHMGTRNSKMLLTTGFRLCNMCFKFHVDYAPVERPLSETTTVLQLWIHRVKLDCLEIQQINHINGVYPVNMGSDIPLIEYEGVSSTKLTTLLDAMQIRQAGAWSNVISSQAARKIMVPLDPQ